MISALQQYALMGVGVAFIGLLAWSLLWHGPSQYRAGVQAERIAAEARFQKATESLNDDADKALARAVKCRADGHIWLSGQLECKRD